MTRHRLIALAAALGVVAVAGVYLAYDQFLRGDSVAPLTLASASPPDSTAASSPSASARSAPPTTAATATAGASAGPTGTPTGTSAAGEPSPSEAAGGAVIAGTWTVSDGSLAGYRVREKLAGLPAESDAVGRTDDVTGEIVIAAAGDGIAVEAGTITVDLTTLESDDSRRDRRLTEMGIETARYQTTTFTLTGPVSVPPRALTGETVEVTLTGDLELHGVTKAVSIPAQARLLDDQVEVTGSLTFPFADFEIEPPNIAGFVTVEDEGTLEFLLILRKA